MSLCTMYILCTYLFVLRDGFKSTICATLRRMLQVVKSVILLYALTVPTYKINCSLLSIIILSSPGTYCTYCTCCTHVLRGTYYTHVFMSPWYLGGPMYHISIALVISLYLCPYVLTYLYFEMGSNPLSVLLLDACCK
jgi:hypothetical protein